MLAVIAEAPAWEEILRTVTLRAGYNTTWVTLGTALLGLAAGVVGVFALLRKRSLTADALSHATLPGITIAFLVAVEMGMSGRSVPMLLAGAAATGLLGVVTIQAILRHTRLTEDAAIGIVLSVFFGAGVVGLSYVQSNASAGAAGMSHLIYGQTATITRPDAVMMGVVAVVAVGVALAMHKELALVCFNASYARVNGVSVTAVDAALMGMIVVVTVVGLQAVGMLLVIAMLIIPAASARFWTDRLRVMVVVAGATGGVSGYLGSVASALTPDTPAGAVIVLVSGGVFAVSMVAAPKRGLIATAARAAHTKLRIAGDHLLEVAHETGLDEGERLPGEALAGVARERGWSGAFARMVAWWVQARGLARGAGESIALTAEGLARGAQVHRNHQLWEQYLISYADIAPTHVDWSVDQVEHVLDGALVDELEAALAERGVRVPEPPASGGAR